MLEVKTIKAGMFSSIQDGGRKGLSYYAIPPSGFMDRTSAQRANILVGNKKNAPLIEMTYIGGTFQFSEDAVIALTGANMQFEFDESPLKMNQTILVKKDSILKCKYAINGVRAYLAINGDWQIPKIYKSTSTYTYAQIGGLNGSALQKDDTIYIQSQITSINIIQWKQSINYKIINKIPLQKGPEWYFLKNEDNLQGEFSISPQSNRMGAILSGNKINIDILDTFPSQAVFPGVVQCTPSGKLIVVLQDGQTTGGYPRVGIIPKKALDIFNQLRIGQGFRFEISR